MDLNLDLLAQETIDLSKNMKEGHPRQFDGHQLDLLDFEYQEESPEIPAIVDKYYREPEGPGLAFRIEKGIQTFCIRAALVDQIEYLPRDLEQGDRRLFQALRIDELKQLRDVYTFETDTLELAEVILDQFCNRRFPYQEQDLFNLSDPGFSWWLEEKPGSLQIIFQSPGINSRYESLGPLGDGAIAAKRFKTIFSYLAEKDVLQEYVSTQRSITIKHGIKIPKCFALLRELIVEGKDVVQLLQFNEQFEHSRDARTVQLYLKEFSLLRQFWLEIVDRL